MQVDSVKTRLESARGVCNQLLKLICDEPLSNVAFNFSLRRYIKDLRALFAPRVPIANAIADASLKHDPSNVRAQCQMASHRICVC